MSLKIEIFVVLIVLLGFFNVESVGNFPQPSNSQSSTSHNVQVKNKEEFIANHQQELHKILKFLDENRKQEEEFRKRESSIQSQLTKQQRSNDQLNLDKLELKVREQIEYLLNIYARRLPLNEAYTQQFNVFNKNLAELTAFNQRIAEQRIQDIRTHDQRQIQFYQQQLNARRVLEQSQYLEAPPKGLSDKLDRATEQKELKDADNLLQDNLQRLENWHAKKLPLNDAYNQMTSIIKQNFEKFSSVTKQIDQRRMKERLAEVKEVANLKESLYSRWQFELEQRKKEQPINNEMLAAQRIKDEIEEDFFYKNIQHRQALIEKRLEQNFPFNKDYILQKSLLNEDLQKFHAHLEDVQLQRIKKQNAQSTQKNKG